MDMTPFPSGRSKTGIHSFAHAGHVRNRTRRVTHARMNSNYRGKRTSSCGGDLHQRDDSAAQVGETSKSTVSVCAYLRAVAAGIMLAASICVHAQSNATTSTLLQPAESMKCVGQYAATICAGHELSLRQAQMSGLLQQEREKLAGKPKDLTDLAAAQAAWERFADAECILQVGEPGPLSGSGYPERYARCKQALVETRIEQLKMDIACKDHECWRRPWR